MKETCVVGCSTINLTLCHAFYEQKGSANTYRVTFATVLFFFLFFPFLHGIAIFPMYIYLLCNLRIIRYPVRRWKFFSFSRNRVTRVGHISSFNDQRQSIEGEKRIWIEKGISFDNSISSSFQKKNPFFLPFFPLLLLLFPLRTLADRSLLRRIRRNIQAAPIHRSSKQTRTQAGTKVTGISLSPSPRF